LRTLLHRAFREHRALVQYGHLARDLLDEGHVVLDHHQRMAAREERQLRRALRLLVAHAGYRLVEEQQPGLLHEQHADLQPLLLAVGEQPGHAARRIGEPDERQGIRDAIALLAGQFCGERPAHALVRLHRELQVLESGMVLEDGRFLELAPDAGVRDLRFGEPCQVYGLAEERRTASDGSCR
jgi:hypothetical protein